MFRTKVVEKIKTYILCSVTFFSKIVPFFRYCRKYCKAGQVTHANTAHAHCITKATQTLSQYLMLIAFPL